ncbi:hypothetical protein Tco_0680869 [Tanacetum coccineum]|uniref:Integrase, catalytic region, zinc finger, CCHC-type, peptidase aspartic, catalytic n=1 Tax=Tanacetum coccineum TaxID=301880 RepID=A0ABQ4XMW1_9ASTR
MADLLVSPDHVPASPDHAPALPNHIRGTPGPEPALPDHVVDFPDDDLAVEIDEGPKEDQDMDIDEEDPEEDQIMDFEAEELEDNTLAEYMILFDADNHLPMLDKDLYNSWKSRMELYMQKREHERMILESVENGPLIWPIVEENGVTRTKKYVELSAAEKIQANCDIKATNIILQGLPADIYSLVNHHRVAKDLWERVQLLMQGTSLTKQERECKLYDHLISLLTSRRNQFISII